MSNNPLLHYKPGLTMDAPIDVTMAAADWVAFMTWVANRPDEDLEGVKHLVYGIMSEQVAEAVYTRASIQGAKAAYHEKVSENNPLVQVFQGTIPLPFTAEDAEICKNCGRAKGTSTSAPCLFCPDYDS